MKLKKLGRTGTLVSELCLGTMTFGWHADEATSDKIMDNFVEAGGNFIDTANVYNEGKSEQIIGKWLLQNDRENFVIATKARFQTRNGANTIGLSRKHLYHSVRQSLERLQTDYIDLFQVHAWDPLTPLEETFSAMNSLVEDGLVRYVGISNFRGWQFEKALMLCRSRGWHEPVCLQPHYNIIVRATEYELLPMAQTEGISVIPWSPLAGGILSGKYKDGVMNAPPGTRIGDSKDKQYYRKHDSDRVKQTISVLNEISEETKKSMPQIALNWLLRNPAVTSPIIGARNTEQLADNLGSVNWKLTQEQIERINNASALDVTYPYDSGAEAQQRRGRELS